MQARAEMEAGEEEPVAAAGGGNPEEEAEQEEGPARASGPKFRFPSWNPAWLPPSGHQDFELAFSRYQKIHASAQIAQQLGTGPPTPSSAAPVRSAEHQKRIDQKLTLQAQLHAERSRKAALKTAEKEMARLAREQEKELRQAEREELRKRAEEERRKKKEELDRAREEQAAEKEKLRGERERGNPSRRQWLARSSLPDESLPAAVLPPGILCQWDARGELSPGDLLMAWNFLCTHADALCCPRLSLEQLRTGLLLAERALDLTDVYVALMRVLLLDMDANRDLQTEPKRMELISNLTWPYMAGMYLEENADRLTEAEDALAEDLGTTGATKHALYGQIQRCNHAQYDRIYSMMYNRTDYVTTGASTIVAAVAPLYCIALD